MNISDLHAFVGRRAAAVVAGALFALLAGCSSLPEPREDPQAANADFNYLIGAGDTLNVFVWRNQDLSSSGVPVRPDGKITIPLVEDLPAAGRTPTELARDIEKALGQFVREPQVSVTVQGFVGEPYEQVRVVGAAAKPSALPYRKNMTVLDVLVSVGGLTDYAAGNRATIVRTEGGKQEQYRVRLDDLIRGGDISANAPVRPGDIIVIPEAWF